MVRIAVDSMGGDHAPKVVVDGAVRAAQQFEDLELLLVGPKDAIHRELDEHSGPSSRIEVVDAPEVIAMGESPVEALRRKPHSSIRVMTSLQKEGRCDAAFSAGNTGATVAASTIPTLPC